MGSHGLESGTSTSLPKTTSATASTMSLSSTVTTTSTTSTATVTTTAGDTTTAGEAEATVTPPKTESGPLPSWQREKVAAGPGLAPGYPTGKMVMANDAYNAQMNLMVDTEACREAFRLYDKEDTGTIVKE